MDISVADMPMDAIRFGATVLVGWVTVCRRAFPISSNGST